MKHLVRYALPLLALTFMGAPSWAAQAPPRPASQQEYWSQFDRKDWDAAVKEAERLVTVARQADPVQPLHLGDALALLGNAQFGKGNYIEAEGAFLEALQLIERDSISTSSNLLPPLRGLGYTYAAGGKHAAAVPVLERALLISHRSLGLFDIGQQGILRQLATSLTQTGRAAEAEKHMSYLLRVGQRSYGADNARLIPVLNVVADWYCDTGNFGPARQLYEMALGIANKKLGANSLAAVEPLRGLARTYTDELYFSTLGLIVQRERKRVPWVGEVIREEPRPINPRYLSEDGQEALERALRILEANADRPPAVLTAALIQMGDWHQIKQEPDKARGFYQRALLVEGTAPEESGKSRLGFPVRLHYLMPPSAIRTLYLTPEESEERFVQLELTVASDGTVKDARIVEGNASSRQTADTLQAVRAARFRPKFVDGMPVETTGVTYREVFRTRKKNDGNEADDAGQESERKDAEAEPASTGAAVSPSQPTQLGRAM